MPRIHVLSDQVVNRIAAGEVVERPASVVKELVENSLDAGARRVEVDLEQGGRALVRVSDDGCGMDADDALLALERHATSKIAGAEDLSRISTLGFRGEALPSIAAVSRFTLSTCAEPSAGGVRVTVEGGRVLGVEGLARPRGTTVEVAELFFNLPARRKFLHAAETELRHAQESLWAAALARPEVGFLLRHGGRVLLEVPPVSDVAARLRDLLGRRARGQVHELAAASSTTADKGLIADGEGSGRAALYTMVNGRPVRDRALVGAVLRGLRASGREGSGARVVIWLDVQPDLVDVNVHPAKAEVRFARAGEVLSLLERAVREGGGAGPTAIAGRPTAGVGEQPVPPYGGAASTRSLFVHPAYADETTEAPVPAVTRTSTSSVAPGVFDTPYGRLIGQYRDSFLLLEDDQGLVIVDQHVAHERVLFERILKRRSEGERPAQLLLMPQLLELDEALAAALPRVEELLASIGVEADLFGTSTVRVLALPPELPPAAAPALLSELLERATSLEGEPAEVATRLEEEVVAMIACKAAIKVNHPLTPVEQRALLRDLAQTEQPWRCPHGRPILLRLSQEEMERRLGRR